MSGLETENGGSTSLRQVMDRGNVHDCNACVDYLAALCKSLNPVTVKIMRSSKNTVLEKTVMQRLTNTTHTGIFAL